MTESLKSPNVASTHRWLYCAVLGVVMAGALFGCWVWFNSDPPFSQQQYDDGYLQAFRMNMSGPGRMDFRREFWSMQDGFDDAISDFKKIYEHPNEDPFSYSKIERFRDVLSHIESTDILEPDRRDVILKQLHQDLDDWETHIESKSGG